MALDRIVKVLQIQPIGVPETVRLSQNENGRSLIFQLVGNETAIPNSATVTLSGTKPDGVVYSAVGAISSDVVTFAEDTQMTAAAGIWDAKIQITKSGETVATARIRFVIDADPVAPGSVPSESELDGLVAQAQNYATIARGAAYGSPLTASTAAAMTDHERVYVYTGSETGYVSGNWYYWNGSAWVSGGIYNSEGIETDTTLTVAGMAADAKATGDAIAAIVPGLSNDAKKALLDCFANVAWINWEEAGESYYDALADAIGYVPPEPPPSFEYGIYEPEELVNGKYIDGTGTVVDGQANKSFYIADYIPVVAAAYWIALQPGIVTLSNSTMTSEANWRVSEYDENKTFIKQTQFANGAYGAYAARIFEVDENTKYMRLGWYDPYTGSSAHKFDIENPQTITELAMESGDINGTTGQNATETKRIRTTGYLEASGTITTVGCPFGATWSSSPLEHPVYAIRCYDSSKNYLGSVAAPNPIGDLTGAALVSGTAYIRIIMQGDGTRSFIDFAKMVAYLYTINGVRYYVTG